MELPVDEFDFPPCMNLIPMLKKIPGVSVANNNGSLRLVLQPGVTLEQARQEMHNVQDYSIRMYRNGGVYRSPADFAEFAYNMHVFLHAQSEIGISSLSSEYAAHFGHPFPMDKFVLPRTSLALGLTYFSVAVVHNELGKETTITPKLPLSTTYKALRCILEKNPPPPPVEHDAYDEPAFKRRRVMADVDSDVLDSTLRALHSLLVDLSETDENMNDQLDDIDVPIRGLEEEFESRWKVKFDPEAFGISSILQFLKKFPKVFCVINNGVEMVVRPQASPIFEIPEDGGVGSGTSSFLTVRPYTLGAATRFAALCVNIAAENAASNTEFEEKFASYDQVQQLIDILVEGKAGDNAIHALQDVTRPDPDKVVAPAKALNYRAM